MARSTFRSQNVKNTRGSGHFWKLRCRKSARRCGAKHISKSKCTKHLSVGPLLEVEMSKNAVVARSTFRSQNVQNTPPSDHLWKLRCRNSDSLSGIYSDILFGILSGIYSDIFPGILSVILSDRRKFRSQTSDNMDR